MKKKISIYIALVAVIALSMSACYDDKGNYEAMEESKAVKVEYK